MSIYSTKDWFLELSSQLKQTQVRVFGEEVSFQKGEQVFNQLLKKVQKARGTIWWIGNGGSSAVCSHLSQDVLGKLNINSVALNDSSLLTCISNDFGYEEVYARPLRTLLKENDLLIAISSSGNSENILKCISEANDKKVRNISLSGFKSDNKLWNIGSNLSFYYPAQHYGTVEVGHMALLHALIEVKYFCETNQQK